MNVVDKIKNRIISIDISKKIIVWFIIAAVITLFADYITYTNKIANQKTEDLVQHNYNIQYKIQRLLTSLQNEEIIQYRNITTNDTLYEKYYKNSLDSIGQNLKQLDLNFNNPKQKIYFNQLQNIIQAHLEEIKEIIKKRDEGGKEATKKYLLNNIDDEHIPRIKSIIRSMEEEEDSVLEIRLSNVNNPAQNTAKTFVVAAMTEVIILSLLLGMILSDVKKRKFAEIRAIENESKLKLVMDTVPALIYVKDRDLKYTQVNNSFLTTLGKKRQEIIKHTTNELFDKRHSGKFNKEDIQILTNGSQIITKEEMLETEAGIRWYSTSKVPLKDVNGEIKGIVGVSTDITKRIQAEKILQDSEQKLKELDKSKNKIFSILSHDLRSPFNSLIGFTENLKEYHQKMSTEEMDKTINQIYKAAKKSYDLVENMLQWTTIETGRLNIEPKLINFYQNVEDVFTLVRGNAQVKGINLINEVNPFLEIYADTKVITSVLQNLVSNSIKFTKAGGSVFVKGEVTHKKFKGSVRDTGVGMQMEAQKQLFDISNNNTTIGTKNEMGTGLGLLISKSLIEKCNGIISVNSEPNKGTTFIFTIPQVEIRKAVMI